MNAVTYLTPRIREALQTESFFTPEGYNVLDPDDAEAYLVEVHGRDLDKIRAEFDASTGFHLAMSLQREDRAAVYENGKYQNVAEHSLNLSVTSIWVALAERPDLSAAKVAIMAVFHDLVPEAYGGDTQIHDKEAMASKEARELASMTLFLRDVGQSVLGDVMREYHEGRSKEARFVKGMDKVEAYQFSLATKAKLHKDRDEDFITIVKQALPKAAIDRTAYKKMKFVLKELGHNWLAWGCKPFEGDPDHIVDSIALHILDQGAEVVKLPISEEQPTIEDATQVAEVKRLPLRRLFEFIPVSERPVIEPDVLRQLGVTSITKARQSPNPTPTPPAPAAFAVAA